MDNEGSEAVVTDCNTDHLRMGLETERKRKEALACTTVFGVVISFALGIWLCLPESQYSIVSVSDDPTIALRVLYSLSTIWNAARQQPEKPVAG